MRNINKNQKKKEEKKETKKLRKKEEDIRLSRDRITSIKFLWGGSICLSSLFFLIHGRVFQFAFRVLVDDCTYQIIGQGQPVNKDDW